MSDKDKNFSIRSKIGLMVFGILLGIIIIVVFALQAENSQDRFENHNKIRWVMETYYFGNGLTQQTGDTSILEKVVTDSVLQRRIESCNKKDLCIGSSPAYMIGNYFNIYKMTDEFAVVELDHRPIIEDTQNRPSGYRNIWYVLLRVRDEWRVNSAYLGHNYLPEKYK